MRHERNLSEALSKAGSLPEAMGILLTDYPNLSVELLIAAERAEIVEMGWSPSSRHSDCSHLVSLAALLRPMAERKGDISVTDAFTVLVESGDPQAEEIARILKGS